MYMYICYFVPIAYIYMYMYYMYMYMCIFTSACTNWYAIDNLERCSSSLVTF